MNVCLRKGGGRSGRRAGLAAEAGPVSRSFDLLTPDIGYLSLTLLADPQGVRRRIDHASVDTCAAHFYVNDPHSVLCMEVMWVGVLVDEC